MKIAFLDPCDYKFYGNKTGAPLGLAYMASYVEEQLGNEFEFSIDVDVNQVLKRKPDLVAISAYTETFARGVRYAEIIKKETDIPIIIGGKHITALPHNLKKCFDVGVVGDGERPLTELVKTFVDKKGFFPEDLANIKGLVFQDGNERIITPSWDPIQNLDILPPPKRNLLHTFWPEINIEWYWSQFIYTSRGCPYKCPFCIHSKITFVSRYHSPERVVQEISEIIRDYPEQKLIGIFDDLFTISKKRLKSIVELIRSEKIHRKVAFSCMCKANLFDDEIAYLLKMMNVKLITFGFESGDEKTLQYLKKDSSKVQQNLDTIKACNKYGIDCGGYFILGSPPETKEALNKTYWFMRSNYPPMSMVGAFCLTPFPGTKTWDDALEKGIVNPESEDWESYNYINYDFGKAIHLNNNYDHEFFKEVYEKYFIDLNIKNTTFSDKDNYDFELNYYSEVFKLLKQIGVIKEDSEVLEVGTYYTTKSINDYFQEDKNLTKFDHWIYQCTDSEIKNYEKEKLSNKQFDLLVFNHSLEQLKNPSQKLNNFIAKNLKKDGKLIILLKNESNIHTLVNILSNKFNYNISGFKKIDNYFKLNSKTLKKTLKTLPLTNTYEIPIKMNISQELQKYTPLIEDLSKSIDIKTFISNMNTYSHIFIATKA